MFLVRSNRAMPRGTCRKCAWIRGFVLVAFALMLILPIFGPSLPLLASLSVWHFVAALWAWGLLVSAAKWMEWRRDRRAAEARAPQAGAQAAEARSAGAR
ncbi:MAG: hypothetical protein RL123_327 [Pseudomonadota bacterium]